MIALIIIAVLLLIIAAVLFLPLDAIIEFKDDFFFKLKFSGIGIFKLNPDKKKKEEKTENNQPSNKTTREKENKASTYFKKLKEKHGFSGTIKLLLGFLRDLIPHIRKLLKHIKIRNVVIDIIIAEDDAAKTAIEYGGVCAVAYPVLSGLESVAGVKYKAINIKSDFEGQNSSFAFKGDIRTRIIFLLIALIKVYSEYKKFTARIEKDERK